MRHTTLAALVLSACFAEPAELDLVVGSSEGTEATTASDDDNSTSSGSSTGATSSGSSSVSGGTSSEGGESGSSEGATSDGSSDSSGDEESSSTGEPAPQPYGPCWPGEPDGGSQCAPGPHGSLCVADDDRQMTGYACTSECESADDCPAPSSGMATPACADSGDFGVCILDCTQDGDCPEMMVCSVYATAALDPWPAACVWPWGWWQ